MQYDGIFSGEYQIRETLEHSLYSLLCIGEQSATGQVVLIRLWPEAQALLEEEQRRIRAEVAAIQDLHHPHILPFLDVYTTAQGVALVSPVLPAGTLNTRLSQDSEDAFSYEEARLIIQQVGQALQALHDQDITHGNLTPQSIGFTLPEQVSLGEFRLPSILRCIHNYQSILEEELPRCLYMAPEQFSGIYDPRGDQYALGCLAYVLFTGRVPFAGSTRAALFQKQLFDQPRPLTEINAALAPDIEAAVLKALAKDPEQRHNSVQRFLEALALSTGDSLLDLETRKQPSVVIGVTGAVQAPLVAKPSSDPLIVPVPEDAPAEAADVEHTWEWDGFSNPSVAVPMAQSGNAAQATVTDLPPLSLAVVPTSYNPGMALNPRKRKRGYILVPVAFLLLIFLFLSARLLLFPTDPAQPQKIVHGVTPTAAMLLTPVTRQAAAQPTPTGTIAVIQIPPTPTPTPFPTPTPKPTPTPTVTSATALTPVLNCVSQTGTSFLAKFGYRNSSATAITMPVGSNNFMSPSFFNGAQPTHFAPGTQAQIFQIHFYNGMELVWSLDGRTATASSKSPRC